MFVGHYAPAYVLKRHYREAPLWALVLAVQAVDILFFLFVPLGIERMQLIEGRSGPLASDLEYMPFTHSLAMTLAYLAACVLAGRAAGRPRLGLALGLAVASHWVADLLVHVPDLPLAFADGPNVGLGLWRYHRLSYALEILLLAGGFLWLRPVLPAGAARRWAWIGFGVLVGLQTVSTFFLPPPPSPNALAAAAEVSYLVVALLAVPVDRALRAAPA